MFPGCSGDFLVENNLVVGSNGTREKPEWQFARAIQIRVIRRKRTRAKGNGKRPRQIMKLRLILTTCALFAALAVPNAFGRSSYQSQIPNGTVFSCSTCHGALTAFAMLSVRRSTPLAPGVRHWPARIQMATDLLTAESWVTQMEPGPSAVPIHLARSQIPGTRLQNRP